MVEQAKIKQPINNNNNNYYYYYYYNYNRAQKKETDNRRRRWGNLYRLSHGGNSAVMRPICNMWGSPVQIEVWKSLTATSNSCGFPQNCHMYLGIPGIPL